MMVDRMALSMQSHNPIASNLLGLHSLFTFD